MTDAKHEALADPCESHRSMGFHIDPCCPHCEAPAEGAGEAGPIDRILADADSRLKRKDPDINGARVCLHGARLALLAHSSAPEALKGDAK